MQPISNWKHQRMVALVLALLQLLWLAVSSSSFDDSLPIAKPNCAAHCGSVAIPYPFGIGANCSQDSSHEIHCNYSFDPPKPFLQHYNLEVTDINWPGRYSGRDPRRFRDYEIDDQRLTVLTPARNICASGSNGSIVVPSVDFGGSLFRFSSWFNVFMVENYCGHSVVLRNRGGKTIAGCASVCSNQVGVSSTNTNDCYGVGCCKASLVHSTESSDFIEKPLGLDFYEIVLHNEALADTTSNTCTLAAALIDSNLVVNIAGRLSNASTLPTVLEWDAALTDFRSGPHENVSCYLDSQKKTQGCSCNLPYEGNPYLPDGCQVVRECRKCKHHCNIDVLFNPHRLRYYCENPLLKLGPVLGFSLSMGLVILLLGCYWLYRVVKKKKEAKRKAKYFKRNGGLLLQQHMSSSAGAFDRTKVFPVIELEKATNNFNKNRILGQGGQGTVYKGMLTDGKIVAIKKSKLVDESQLEHFVNELVILSQINHRNVVKLLGCCLETEVPLLIYEFVPNGTLYHLLQASSEDFQLTWKMRLQIAAESADAIAYLHSSSGTPVFHRDIKSSNILLDEKYRAKVSDFGTSRAITIEQTHVTTCVMGTYGYLDPEYFQSNLFTEKSDVYSFGVVLVELLTGRKPICPTKSGGWISLAFEFLSHMETYRLFDILDARVLEEGKKEEVIVVANLAKQCLNMSGKQRPTMKEIAVALNRIRSHKVPILKEPESDETNKCLVSEMSDLHRTPLRSTSFFSDDNLGSCGSFDVQPIMHSTF